MEPRNFYMLRTVPLQDIFIARFLSQAAARERYVRTRYVTIRAWYDRRGCKGTRKKKSTPHLFLRVPDRGGTLKPRKFMPGVFLKGIV